MKTLRLSIALFIVALMGGCASTETSTAGLDEPRTFGCNEMAAKLLIKRHLSSAHCEDIRKLPSHE